MKTIVKIDLDNDERRRFKQAINGKGKATRKDINEFVLGCIAAALAPVSPPDKTMIPPVATRSTSRLLELANRERELEPALAGKSDGFVIGWCKVRYAGQLS